jgi:AraC-like DNA-binding protein
VQFAEDFLGQSFFHIPELRQVEGLLARARQGVRFFGPLAQSVASDMVALSAKDGWHSVVALIDILCQLSETKDYELLASPGFSELMKKGNEEKISHIFNYMVQHYKRPFTLDEIAEYVHMNKAAFCRYFKKSTTKTFSQLLNEIRIGFACKEIIYTDKPMSEIAYYSGYMSVPYFHRMFKRIKKITPQQYKNRYAIDSQPLQDNAAGLLHE